MHTKGPFIFKYYKMYTQTSISKYCNLATIAFKKRNSELYNPKESQIGKFSPRTGFFCMSGLLRCSHTMKVSEVLT